MKRKPGHSNDVAGAYDEQENVQSGVARDTGNKFDSVNSVERNDRGEIVAQPGDVRYVRDEVAPVDERAREQGEV